MKDFRRDLTDYDVVLCPGGADAAKGGGVRVRKITTCHLNGKQEQPGNTTNVVHCRLRFFEKLVFQVLNSYTYNDSEVIPLFFLPRVVFLSKGISACTQL